MDVNLVLALGLILTAGLFGSRLLRRLRLPAVTGYIIMGLLLGPSVGGVIPAETVAQLDILTSITLAVVAFLSAKAFGLTRCVALEAAYCG